MSLITFYQDFVGEDFDALKAVEKSVSPAIYKHLLNTAAEVAFLNGKISYNKAKSIIEKLIGDDDAKKFEDKLWLLYPNLCDQNSGN